MGEIVGGLRDFPPGASGGAGRGDGMHAACVTVRDRAIIPSIGARCVGRFGARIQARQPVIPPAH